MTQNIGRHDYKFRGTWLWFWATWLRARWLSGDLTVKRKTREYKTYVFWTSAFKNCLPKFFVVYHPHIQIDMTIAEKYLELRKNLWIEKIIDTCSPTLKTDQNLAYTSRCLKEKISHKMCWIFHETLPIWLPIRRPLKTIVYDSWKVLKICLRASKR